ncbi:MAG: tetratricopeptide repeat protein [Candidatus Omnitrophica bacterium]|nr:tetratricopeptide repeat protein [Candidatus Omnitrophota bacterium]
MISEFFKSTLLQIILLFVVLCATYSNSLHNDFMIDDHGLILQDTKIHNLKNIYYQFIPDLYKTLQLEGQEQSFYYRPFAHVLPMICYIWFGENVFGYHVFNLVLFYLAILALYFLIVRLFGSRELAFFTGLLYAVHPLNGMFVNYITASVFGFQVLVLSISFLLFLKALDQQRPFLMSIGGLFFYILGLLCHEVSFVFLLLLVVTVILLKRSLFKKSISVLLPYVIISVFYFVFRLNFAGLRENVFDKVQYAPLNIVELVTSNIKIFFWYLSKFFYFDGIVLKIVTEPVRDHFWLWFAAAILIIPVAVYWYKKKDVVKLWGLGFFIVGFAPSCLGTSFELRYGVVFEPHWMFYPSLGMFVILASFLVQFQKRIGQVTVIVLATLIAANMMVFTRHLNKIWGDEIQYCRYWLKYSPEYNGAQFFLAAQLMDEYPEEARELYHKALAGDQYDWGIYSNLALMAKADGNREEEIKYLEKALEFYPRSVIANNNLGAAYLDKGDSDTAMEYFQKAIEYNPYTLEPRLNMARIYEKQENYEKNLELYEENLAISPRHERSLLGKMQSLVKLQRQEDVMFLVSDVMGKNLSADFYLKAAVLFAESPYFNLSLPFFQKALEIDGQKGIIYEELGRFLANMNKLEEAVVIWQEGAKVDPENETLKTLIEEVHALQKQQ